MSDRLTVRPVSPLARASARKRAYAADETNDETSTERRLRLTDERPHRLDREEVKALRKHHPVTARKGR